MGKDIEDKYKLPDDAYMIPDWGQLKNYPHWTHGVALRIYIQPKERIINFNDIQYIKYGGTLEGLRKRLHEQVDSLIDFCKKIEEPILNK